MIDHLTSTIIGSATGMNIFGHSYSNEDFLAYVIETYTELENLPDDNASSEAIIELSQQEIYSINNARLARMVWNDSGINSRLSVGSRAANYVFRVIRDNRTYYMPEPKDDYENISKPVRSALVLLLNDIGLTPTDSENYALIKNKIIGYIRYFGVAAVEAIESEIFSELNYRSAHLILDLIGTMEDDDSKEARVWLARQCLSHGNPAIVSGAINAIVSLGDVESRDALELLARDTGSKYIESMVNDANAILEML